MKTFQQYLEDFKREIETGYNEASMVSSLCGHVFEDSKGPPTTLFGLDGPPKPEKFGEMDVMNIVLKSKPVTPQNAGFPINLGDWAEDPEHVGMEMVMRTFGKKLADREYWIIANGLTSSAGSTIEAKQKGQLSMEDISAAQDKVVGTYADCVLMAPAQEAEFLKKDKIFPIWRMPLGLVPKNKRSYYFAGMLGGVNVYVAAFAKDYAVVFSRDEIVFSSTPLTANFDNADHPKQLILRKVCASAPMYNEAVCKIAI